MSGSPVSRGVGRPPGLPAWVKTPWELGVNVQPGCRRGAVIMGVDGVWGEVVDKQFVTLWMWGRVRVVAVVLEVDGLCEPGSGVLGWLEVRGRGGVERFEAGEWVEALALGRRRAAGLPRVSAHSFGSVLYLSADPSPMLRGLDVEVVDYVGGGWPLDLGRWWAVRVNPGGGARQTLHTCVEVVRRVWGWADVEPVAESWVKFSMLTWVERRLRRQVYRDVVGGMRWTVEWVPPLGPARVCCEPNGDVDVHPVWRRAETIITRVLLREGWRPCGGGRMCVEGVGVASPSLLEKHNKERYNPR